MSLGRLLPCLLTSPGLLKRLSSTSGAPFWGAHNLFRFINLPSDYPLFFMSFGPLALYVRIRRHPQMMDILPPVSSEGLHQCELSRCPRAHDTDYLCWIAKSGCKCRLLSRISGSCSPHLHARYLIRNLTCIAALSRRLSGRPGSQLGATIRCYFTSGLRLLDAGECEFPGDKKYPKGVSQ